MQQAHACRRRNRTALWTPPSLPPTSGGWQLSIRCLTPPHARGDRPTPLQSTTNCLYVNSGGGGRLWYPDPPMSSPPPCPSPLPGGEPSLGP